MSSDLESSSTKPPAVNNPYANINVNELPPHHPIIIIKRSIYIAVSLYCLHYLKCYDAIFHSPKVRHEWLKIGLAGSVAILAIKIYVETYSGKLKKQTVNYKNFPHSTHTVLALLLVNTVSFHVALWKHYGATTFAVIFLAATILFQVTLMIPTLAQNILGIVFFTLFLQLYK